MLTHLQVRGLTSQYPSIIKTKTMDLERDALEYLLEQLKAKASIKQLVFRNLQEVFRQLREEGKRITDDLENRIKDIDTSVKVGFQETGDFEFSLHFGGDTLVFYMQSNIITFKDDYPLMQSHTSLKYPPVSTLGILPFTTSCRTP